jgi:site-specific recombinase XerD
MTEKPIETRMQSYFQTLSQHAPQTTVNSHRSSIRPFVTFCLEIGVSSRDVLSVTHVHEFLKSRLASHSTETIKGHIDSLANFLAYVWTSDPAIVKARIYDSPNEFSTGGGATWADISAAASPGLDANDPQIAAVEMLLDYLRHRRYGSRIHALVELLTATAGQPSVVQQVDVDDLDRNESRVTIQISQTHAVSAHGLLQERTVSLPSRTMDALGVYLDHERVVVEDDDCPPLFTTPAGRVDPSTIRKSIKKASQTSLTTPVVERSICDRSATDSRDDEPVQTVTPSEIWQYSLTQRIDR